MATESGFGPQTGDCLCVHEKATTMKNLFVILSLLAVSPLFAEERALFTVYAQKYEGRVTANGEVFSHAKMTVATNKQKYLGKTITLCYSDCVSVRVNDVFGPEIRRDKRTRFDLARAVAKSIGMGGKAWGTVRDYTPFVGVAFVLGGARENTIPGNPAEAIAKRKGIIGIWLDLTQWRLPDEEIPRSKQGFLPLAEAARHALFIADQRKDIGYPNIFVSKVLGKEACCSFRLQQGEWKQFSRTFFKRTNLSLMESPQHLEIEFYDWGKR